LPDDLDFLLHPVKAGMIPFTAIYDGSVSLADICLMNDYLEAETENEYRVQKYLERKNK
jgi:hypothetical protein